MKTETVVCKKCGNQFGKNDKYCTKCGRYIGRYIDGSNIAAWIITAIFVVIAFLMIYFAEY